MNKRGYYAAHGFEELRKTARPHGAEQKIIFAKAKTTLFAFAPCAARAVQGKRVNFRPFYNRKALKEGEKSGETIAERQEPRTMVSP